MVRHNFRSSICVLVLALMAIAVSAVGEAPDNKAYPKSTLCVFDMGSLSEFDNLRDAMRERAEREVKEFGLEKAHVQAMLDELARFHLLVFDTVATKGRNTEQKEFEHGRAPKLLLTRRGGEYAEPKEPSKDERAPLIYATAEVASPVVTNIDKKEVIIKISIRGMRGPGWRATKTPGERWLSAYPLTVNLALDGAAYKVMDFPADK